MEFNRFTSTKKKLKIGDIVVSCFREERLFLTEIPFSGMAFFHPEMEGADLEFVTGTVEPDESGQRLFGSENYRYPTFLYQRDSGEYEWITWNPDDSPRLSFRISSDWKKFTLYEDKTDTKGERAFKEFGSLFSYAVLNFDACVLHGVVMEYNGKGILVTASSGTGKTTHTRMWRDHKNALIINGDRCLCRKIDGKWYAYGMPWAGSSGEYINRRVPIFCIVNLQRGEENTVEPMSEFDAAIYLMQRVFSPMWPGDLQLKAIERCEELAKEIPVLSFHCRPDLDSVETLCSYIENMEL